ncbi:nucleoprotein/polynucleotide-associated enzyme [Vibrio sp. JCM 19236]|nr:nucleoprotein/polynucleotide-associated enzyme [Vibrio sp. JCM 19236]
MAKLTLQEQMLKAGLVNEKKLKKAKKGAKKSRVQAREAKAAAEENRIAQQERDKKINQEREQQRLAKELKAQVKQLIDMNRIDISKGEIKYNFTDGTLVKALYVED